MKTKKFQTSAFGCASGFGDSSRVAPLFAPPSGRVAGPWHVWEARHQLNLDAKTRHPFSKVGNEHRGFLEAKTGEGTTGHTLAHAVELFSRHVTSVILTTVKKRILRQLLAMCFY